MKQFLGVLQFTTKTGEMTLDMWQFFPCGTKSRLETLLGMVSEAQNAEKLLAQMDEFLCTYIGAALGEPYVMGAEDTTKSDREWIANHLGIAPEKLLRRSLAEKLCTDRRRFVKWCNKHYNGIPVANTKTEQTHKTPGRISKDRIAWANMYRYSMECGLSKTEAAAYADSFFPNVRAC